MFQQGQSCRVSVRWEAFLPAVLSSFLFPFALLMKCFSSRQKLVFNQRSRNNRVMPYTLYPVPLKSSVLQTHNNTPGYWHQYSQGAELYHHHQDASCCSFYIRNQPPATHIPFFFFFFFSWHFIYLLVLPYINMNPPQVYIPFLMSDHH